MGHGQRVRLLYSFWMVTMPVQSLQRVVNATHYAKDRGLKTAREFALALCDDIRKSRRIVVVIKDLDKDPVGPPVSARIWQGQWIADCECGGASFIDPEDPFFFCFGCGNRSNKNRPRPVIVPDNWREIEAVLLERPVDDMAGLTDLERVALAKPLIMVDGKGGLARNWNPSETVAELREQNQPVEKWRKSLKTGGR